MIRSITVGLPTHSQASQTISSQCREFFSRSQDILKEYDIDARTFRYTLPPLDERGEEEGFVNSTLHWVTKLAQETNVRWFCLPFDFVPEQERRNRLSLALDVVEKFPMSFVNFIVSDSDRMNVGAINDVSGLIRDISKKSNNGFDNFRVGASCACPSNSPFFPFSKHTGDELAFSMALELSSTVQAAADTIDGPIDVAEFRDKAIAALSDVLQRINSFGLRLSKETGVIYKGVDASLAPFPGDKISVAQIVEKLISAPIGSSSSVFVTSILTDILRAAVQKSGAKTVGFNGVMYSLLEDHVLAQSNSRREIDMTTLISLSTVCACGIDMVPIPGTTLPEDISALILDVAGISMALQKPLGVRVLPIPFGHHNGRTEFNLDFLCDSRIMEISKHGDFFTTKGGEFEFKTNRYTQAGKAHD